MTYVPGQPCPNCGKKLVVRARRMDGNRFLGCMGYPECKFATGDVDLTAVQPSSGIDKVEAAAVSQVLPPVFDFRELECIKQLCVNSLSAGGRRFSELAIIQKIEAYRDKLTGAKREARQELSEAKDQNAVTDVLARAKALSAQYQRSPADASHEVEEGLPF